MLGIYSWSFCMNSCSLIGAVLCMTFILNLLCKKLCTASNISVFWTICCGCVEGDYVSGQSVTWPVTPFPADRLEVPVSHAEGHTRTGWDRLYLYRLTTCPPEWRSLWPPSIWSEKRPCQLGSHAMACVSITTRCCTGFCQQHAYWRAVNNAFRNHNIC